jgi:hypothetical protein
MQCFVIPVIAEICSRRVALCRLILLSNFRFAFELTLALSHRSPCFAVKC